MATNPPRVRAGVAQSAAAPRPSIPTPAAGSSDSESGCFIDQKPDSKPFKGVRRER